VRKGSRMMVNADSKDREKKFKDRVHIESDKTK